MKYISKPLCAAWAVGFAVLCLQVILNPLVMNNITFILKNGSAESNIVFVYIGIFLFSTIFTCIGNTVYNILKQRMIFALNAKHSLEIMSKILYTESVFMQKNAPEKIVTRSSRDVNDCSDFKVSTVLEFPLIITGLASTCCIMFRGTPHFLTAWGINSQQGNSILAAVIILMVPLHLSFLLFNGKFMKIEQAQIEAHENEIHLATESLRAIEDVRSSFAFDFILKRLKDVYEKTQNNKTKLFVLFSTFQNISGLAWGITQIIVLGISAWLITKTESGFKFEDYNGFCLLCGMFNQYVTRCANVVLDWLRAKPAQKRISELHRLNNRFKYLSDCETLESNAVLKFKNVTYRIANRNILTDVDFELLPGEHVALVGPSGSGKSTFLKLAMCHLNPTSGDIQYGGKSLQNVNFKDYASKVAYVSQHPFIFQGSFLENILVGRDINVSMQTLIALIHDVALVPDLIKRVLDTPIEYMLDQCPEAGTSLRQYLAEKYNCSQINDEKAVEIIKNSPLLHPVLVSGLSCKVDSAGKNISGGQAAKLALARALIGNPEIILLDEITSSLDEISQETIINTLTQKYKKQSVLFITHRLAAISGIARIVVMKSGEIVQDGEYDNLRQTDGVFADLIAHKTIK